MTCRKAKWTQSPLLAQSGYPDPRWYEYGVLWTEYGVRGDRPPPMLGIDALPHTPSPRRPLRRKLLGAYCDHTGLPRSIR
ncbi:hypothetical protein CLCR_05289 [Cladophialophora carrionii]|uniref:Uncharacterized protein n=1 Tax=Cladophialophora carrionii TaxID=86049 RepID=A0A1C1CLL5_9EURO|nr:hypothetical protein CLCR_05289 [Cladophialophora carrionii]